MMTGVNWVRTLLGCVLVGAVCCVQPVRAAVPRLQLGRTIDITQYGFSFRGIMDAVEAPSPPPHTRTLNQDGVMVEYFSPVECWQLSRKIGRWTNRSGMELSVGYADSPVMVFDQPQVTRAEYEAIMGGTTQACPLLDEAQLRAWLAVFTGVPNLQPVAVKKTPMHLARVLLFCSDPVVSRQVVCAVVFNRAMPGQSRAPEGWFVFVFGFPMGTDMAAARQTVEQQFLTGIKYNGEPDLSAVKPVVRAPVSAPDWQTPEFRASVQQIKDSIRNLDDWWCAESRHYIVLSNTRRGNNMLLNTISHDMNALWPVYQECLPPFKPIQAVSVVRIIGTGAEYVRYVGQNLSWSAGVWMAERRELVIRALEGKIGRPQCARIMGIIYHEGFHQYIFYATGGRETASWFNEGHAGMFEGADIRPNGKVTVNETVRRYELEQVISRKKVDLNGLFHMSYGDFYAPAAMGDNYAMAWALVYYLEKGAATEHPGYARIIDRYMQALRDPQVDAQAATDMALEGVDVKELEKAFIKFWTSPSQRGRAADNPGFRVAAK